MSDKIETSEDFKRKIKNAYDKLGEIDNNDTKSIYNELVALKKIVDSEIGDMSVFKMEDILKNLRLKYTDTKFIFKNDDGVLTVFYDNDDLADNDSFFDYAYDLADKYLSGNDKYNFTILYNCLNTLP